MATYNTPLITTQGLSLLKAEIAGNDSVTFTKIVFSSDDYSQTSDSSVQSLTALSSLDLTATARSFTDVNGNVKIRGVANNQNTTSAFYIKTYGLYGKNNAGNEILIAVSTAQNANFVPAYNNKQTNQIAYTFNIAISSTNNITLSSSTDVSVTQADIATINNAVNSNASNISILQSNSLQTLGVVPTNDLASISKDGIYSLGGNSFLDAPYSPIYGTITQVGTSFSVKTQVIISNLGEYYYRVVNSWGIEGWFRLSSKDDINSLNSSLSSLQSSLATQTSNISSSVAANSSAIASNATNISTNSSAISSNATQIAANSTANSQAINQVTANIQNVQNQVNAVQGSALQHQGVWQGPYWDWAHHADGIYIIDQNQNSNGLAFFTNGGAGAFSGWGILTLTSTGGDTYGVLHDNGNHMFRNHLYVGSSTFSGWIQY